MASLEGFWTYIVSGTSRGGLLCVRNGVIVGGDNIAFFNGLLSEEHGRITGTILTTRFNDRAQQDGLWGKSPRQYAMVFLGVRSGSQAFGSFERKGGSGAKFKVVLTYRGPVP